jgi:hypothetical protein
LRRASLAENSMCLLDIRLHCITDAFCIPTDEAASMYAVGLSRERTLEEQAAYEALVRRREEFLNRQADVVA